jgi:phage gp37-like protein
MIAELEDAIVARIKAAQVANLWPYKLLTVETYGGQIDESTQSTFRFPAVFVAFTRMKQKHQLGERDRIVVVHLVLYVAARNPRNERATRHGDMHEPGSFQIAEDLIALLENQRVGMPMHQPLMHTDIETLFVARKSDGANAESILAISFECQFAWRAALPECANVTSDDWLKTGQTFYLTPGDNVADAAALIVHAAP